MSNAIEWGVRDWTTAIHGLNGVTIDDTQIPEEGFRAAVVSLPRTLAGPGGKLFARLRATVAP